MPWIDVGTLVSGGPGGVAWVDITGKPAVIAAGADAATARAAIGAGTSNLVLGTTTGSALPGDSTPATIGAATAAQGVPTGGTTGQVLSKTTAADYDTEWVTPLKVGTGSGDAMAGNKTASDLGGVALASGITTVRHGTTAATARPAGADVVWWIGTVEPTNAVAHDVWDDAV